jgi:hypothetical protein
MVGTLSGDGSVAPPKGEHALLSLRAAYHPEWAPFLEKMGIKPIPIEEVVPALAGQQIEHLQKVRVLHDLGQQGQLMEMSESTRAMVASVVTNENRVDEFVGLATTTRNFGEFVALLNVQGIATTDKEEVAVAECTDKSVGNGPNRPTKIVASFDAKGEPKDFAYGADPLHWVECNPFFISMTPASSTALVPIGTYEQAYRTRMLEVVGIPQLLMMATTLDVTYFVSSDTVGMDYKFVSSNGWIDVDHGYVIVERHPTLPKHVRVTSQKTVRFKDLSNFPATLACELGWVYVMQNMASCQP